MRLIDADGLENLLKYAYENFKGISPEKVNKSIGAVLNIIREMPTIESEPVRHGEWKVIRLHNNGYYFVCSECNEEGYLENYCPNCGTKMDRGDE